MSKRREYFESMAARGVYDDFFERPVTQKRKKQKRGWMTQEDRVVLGVSLRNSAILSGALAFAGLVFFIADIATSAMGIGHYFERAFGTSTGLSATIGWVVTLSISAIQMEFLSRRRVSGLPLIDAITQMRQGGLYLFALVLDSVSDLYQFYLLAVGAGNSGTSLVMAMIVAVVIVVFCYGYMSEYLLTEYWAIFRVQLRRLQEEYERLRAEVEREAERRVKAAQGGK